ncbi:MAG: hypothetical protein WBZ31_10440 [Thiobacillus sp.]
MIHAHELTRLVRQCGDRYGFTEIDHEAALQAALNDPESALICFRSIAAEASPANRPTALKEK